MGLGIDVGIHTERHRRAHASLPGDVVERAELAQRLDVEHEDLGLERLAELVARLAHAGEDDPPGRKARAQRRSEEHTSELQSRLHLVCRLLLEKKKSIA